jgi:phosphotransferase family enzyme
VEEQLGGGRTSAPVRVGDTVHRPVRPWTPAVHAVLRHLQAAGFDGAPRVVGVDDRSREVLGYVVGETVGETVPWPAWVFADDMLVRVGRWTRRLHDLTADFVPPPDAVWFAGQRWQPGLVIGHHDAAPFNAVRRADGSVAFVDWDTAGPSSRELDLAYVALTWVPFYPPTFAARVGFRAFDDRSRRLHLLLDAYGFDGDRAAFGAAVAARARRNAAAVRDLAAGGEPTYAALLPMAAQLEDAAAGVDALPDTFWRR